MNSVLYNYDHYVSNNELRYENFKSEEDILYNYTFDSYDIDNLEEEKTFAWDIETTNKNNEESIVYASMLMEIPKNNEVHKCIMNRHIEDALTNIENINAYKTIIYAHNGGNFDYKHLLHYLINKGYKLEEKTFLETNELLVKENLTKIKSKKRNMRVLIKDSKIYSIEIVVDIIEIKSKRKNREGKYNIKLKPKTVIFKDSMLLLTGPLEGLCKDYLKLDLPKNNLDYSLYRDCDTSLTNKELFYCFGDVFGLSFLISKVINKRFEFSYTDYLEYESTNKNKCFLYDGLYKFPGYKHEKILMPKNCKQFGFALGDKLTCASYSFTILKAFLYFEVCKELSYIFANKELKLTNFQEHLKKGYINSYKLREKEYFKRLEKSKTGFVSFPKFSVNDAYRIVFPILKGSVIYKGASVDINHFLKNSYQGGRVFNSSKFYKMYNKGKFISRWKSSNSTGTVIDANSLYPSQMKNKLMPYGNYKKINIKEVESVEQLITNNKDKIYFIDITIPRKCILKMNKFPMLRVTNEMCNGSKGNESFVSNMRIINNILVPEQMRLVLNSIDFINMLDSYDILRYDINNIIEFNSVIGIFNSFIDYFYKIKSTHEGSERLNAKIILNSSYGKFGSKITNDSFEPVIKNEKLSFNKNYVEFDINGYIKNIFLEGRDEIDITNKNIKLAKVITEPYYLPVASVITSEGRSDLKKQTEMIGMQHFKYCDTDSIHTDLPPKEILKVCNNIDNKKLGYWAIEGEFIEGQYIGAKRYAERMITNKTFDNDISFGNIFWDVKCCGLGQKEQKEVSNKINLFETCSIKKRDFYKKLENNEIIEIPNTIFYKDLKTNKIVTGVFKTKKSKNVKNGVIIINLPYMITPNELDLDGYSDLN